MVRHQVIAALAAAVLAASAGAAPQAKPPAASPARPLPVTTSQPEKVLRALSSAEERRDDAITTWVALASVPSPSGGEAARGRELARLFREAGLTVRVLPDGTVEGTLAGSEPGPFAVIAAHLDALHVPGPDLPVRRTPGTIEGPGVLDDASGLAALVETAKALTTAGWTPRREVRFLGTVSEETGLKGAHAYVRANPRIAAFIAVDGILGRVEYGATGVRWTRWTFTGRGGHTLVSARLPSPSIAAARAVAAMADRVETTDALFNVGEIHGGTAPNAVPSEVQVTADLRSDDGALLARLAQACEDEAQRAAAAEGVGVRTEILQNLAAAQLPGHERSELVLGAAEALRYVGIAPLASPRGSSDANAALLRGIPAVAVGATTGRNAHAPVETAETAPLLQGTQALILMTVLVGEGMRDAP